MHYYKILLQLILICIVTVANAQVDQQRAMKYFKEAQALCERDNGRLWGAPICGPMVIFDLQTKTIATSKAEPDETRPRLLECPNSMGWRNMGILHLERCGNQVPRDKKGFYFTNYFMVFSLSLNWVQQQAHLNILIQKKADIG